MFSWKLVMAVVSTFMVYKPPRDPLFLIIGPRGTHFLVDAATSLSFIHLFIYFDVKYSMYVPESHTDLSTTHCQIFQGTKRLN